MGERSYIAGVVAFYFVVSISLVFINKALLSEDAVSVPAPLFITWFQCLVTLAICVGLGRAGASAPRGSWLAQFPDVVYDPAIARDVWRLSLVFVGMVTFNNLCLQYVEVSFYLIARSLTIVFNVAFSFFLLGERTSTRTVATLAVVVAGFVVGSEGEVRFSVIGTLFGVTSSVFVSLNSIATKRALPAVGGNEWALAAYNNANALLLFPPLALATGELGALAAHAHQLVSPTFWLAMLLSGVFGFLINIATILQIKATSPLTHNISGTAKSVVQTALALALWHNPTTPANIAGMALVLAGSLAYAAVRNSEMDDARRRAAGGGDKDGGKDGGKDSDKPEGKDGDAAAAATIPVVTAADAALPEAARLRVEAGPPPTDADSDGVLERTRLTGRAAAV
jgi:GDP-fucose transporter C1